ncbi:hypothetical protein PORY_002401 [Pneumocystis oryctolagi]|uniref:Uncharacterized protein n=1 Tax=Pneumocystis oryctolagi TaxID=42067 RepID=A0ACB7C9T9_9ASCO|nr:hypothetical protein PORY_002401 [Pneumocystis oryctolagi]
MGIRRFDTLEKEALFRNPDKKKSAYPDLLAITAPHIESFNALTDDQLLNLAVKDIGKKSVFDRKNGGLGNKLSFYIEEVQIAKPTLPTRERTCINRKIFPSECRERFCTYKARLLLKVAWSINNEAKTTEIKEFGQIPIMVKSNRCHIEKLSPADLIASREESEELGGYFIVNGNEKIIRMLIVPRRNFVMALVRSSFSNRGTHYTKFGTQIRCVRPDETSHTNTLHYLSDGNCIFRFSWRKNEYLVPVVMILKALINTNDKEIFDSIIGKDKNDTILVDHVEILLRIYKNYEIYNQKQTLEYLGEKFRVVLNLDDDLTYEEVGKELLKKVVFVHLQDNYDKFRLLIFMIRKLYSLVFGECCPDNPDSAQNQEILLGGFLYGMIIKEKIEDYLFSLKNTVLQDLRKLSSSVNFFDKKYISKLFQRVPNDIGSKLQYFLSTGNLVSSTGLDLQQATGFTIIAEKLNFYRYLSHFRMVHRGVFFADVKTTTVRKLLPEAWGFICPVHTPDGAPCGLLNHLTSKCKIITSNINVDSIPYLLIKLGVDPTSKMLGTEYSCVQLDGKIIGYCTHTLASHISQLLRHWKVEKSHNVPLELEIGLIPKSEGGQYHGLYIFSSRARMTRPVKYLPLNKEDIIGSFEQVYLNIDVDSHFSGSVDAQYSHSEIDTSNMFSILASLTPFSDFNQSPRNMYQCQMAKQTMGTPASSLRYRTDNKLYLLQTGQTPIVRSKTYDFYGLDNFPNGTNAIVAVISYTGYDMEDAMVINKSSYERGFAYATVYKSERVDLAQKRQKGEQIIYHFGFGSDKLHPKWLEKLDADGLPIIGVKLQDGDPLAAYFNETTGKTIIQEYHGTEDVFVEEVRLLGNDSGDMECQCIHIKLRVTRPVTIGDKFSSRHGQKGVCSQKWPAVDMPFSESGMQPDIIINPHAFPSRMTIGMFIESMAGKAGALHGLVEDSTPFTFSEKNTAADYFGKQLVKAGYAYNGNETFYSGITGEVMEAEIFVGVVYYQRLRHMVSDKFQVRTTGPVHSLTHQPVKGRKRAGGIRFGEMERDSIIAHGTAYILQDRLMNCSDYTQSWICKSCGSILSLISSITTIGTGNAFASNIRCCLCASEATGFENDSDLDHFVFSLIMNGISRRRVIFDHIFGENMGIGPPVHCTQSITDAWELASHFFVPECSYKEVSSSVKNAIHILCHHGLKKRLEESYEHTIRVHFTEKFLPILQTYNITQSNFANFIEKLAEAYHIYQQPLILTHFNASESFRQTFHALINNYISEDKIYHILLAWLLENMTFWEENESSPEVACFFSTCKNIELVGLQRHLEKAFAESISQRLNKYIREKYSKKWDKSVQEEIVQWTINKLGRLTFFILKIDIKKEDLNLQLETLACHFLAMLRIDELFDIIVDYPYSSVALGDLKQSMKLSPLRDYLVNSFQQSCKTRLLHPGADTQDIISQYISTIKCFLILDPPGVLLDKVAKPIRKHLKNRNDTIKCIMVGLVGDEASELSEELGQANPSSVQADDDDDDFDNLNWTPDPIDAAPDFRKMNNNDIIKSLVSIYENKDIFVRELQNLLADRLLTVVNYETDKELRNLELLKLRFNENSLQMCDVMLHDISESKRIDANLHKELNNKTPIHASILSRLFWPNFKGETLRLSKEIQGYMDSYAEDFEKLKVSRKLSWIPNLGHVEIEIILEDRTLNMNVKPAQASIILLFQEKDEQTMKDLMEAIGQDYSDCRRNTLFWVKHGVLKEIMKDTFKVLEYAEVETSSKALSALEELISNVQPAEDHTSEEMLIYWSFINGMLTNLGPLTLERIQSTLKMFVPPPNLYNRSIDELREFLALMVKEEQLEFISGQYKLRKQ